MDTKNLIIGIVLGIGISIVSQYLITFGENGRYEYHKYDKIFDTKTGDLYHWGKYITPRVRLKTTKNRETFRLIDGKWEYSASDSEAVDNFY